MTISPPYNVKIINDTDSSIKILASGFDRLILAVDVKWNDESFFEYLKGLKEKAKENNRETIGLIGKEENTEWYFNMNQSGSKGWEWVLKGQEFTLIIGNWLTPISRPSIMIDIGSETLWRVGPREAVEWIMNLIRSVGGEIISVKPSRVDLCVDVLMPDELWTDDLKRYRVTRARKFHPYFEDDRLTGMMIGKGGISARLYDKVFEIERQSKKYWMFDIWKLEEIPEGMKVIRIEFQLRREVIREVAIDTIDDLFKYPDNLWAYCTKNWLKFQDMPGKHHTQRETLNWWKEIQNGFMGVQDAVPIIRNKALRIEEEALRNQALGYLTSLVALEMEEMGLNIPHRINFKEAILSIINSSERIGKDDNDFMDEVQRKRIKYHRSMAKMEQVRERRSELGFPIGNIDAKRIN